MSLRSTKQMNGLPRHAARCAPRTSDASRIELDHHATRVEVDETHRRVLEHRRVSVERGFEGGHAIEPLLGLFAAVVPQQR